MDAQAAGAHAGGPTASSLPLVSIGVAAVVMIVDQVTKSLALASLRDGPVELFWTLRLNLSFNDGVAFSLGRGLSPLITTVGVVLLASVLFFARRVSTARAAIALGLVVGGAAGNLIDRIVRGHGGAVVDFIDFQWWPIFNAADAAITCGAVLLVWASMREPI